MKPLRRIALSVFIGAIIILVIVFLAELWGLLEREEEFISKSLLTFFILIVTAGIILIAGRTAKKDNEEAEDEVSAKFISGLGKFRRVISGIIIIVSVILAFLAIFAAWGIIGGEEMLFRFLGSMIVLAVSGFVIGVACLMGEKKLDIFTEREKGLSLWKILAIILVFVFLSSFFSVLMQAFLFYSMRPQYYF